ncbi:MAG: hypothetical protein RLZ44_1089 [Pseudomonadota bacterium]|jgi:nickel transport protein
MKISAFVLSSALSAAAAAHDLWLEPEGDGYLLLQGHRHSAHAGQDLVPYTADFLRSAHCTDRQGATRELPVSVGYPARLPGDCAVLNLSASSGDWTKTVYGTRNQPPAGLSGVVDSWRALEGIKLLTAWAPALRQPLGAMLELSPQHDPFALQPGDKLRLLVSYRGQPQAGVTVAYDGAPRGVTGDDGRINLRIRHPGRQLVTASFAASLPDGPVAQVVHATALQFDLPEGPAR